MQITIDNKTYETNQLPNGKWTLPDEIKEMLTCTCGALDIDGNRCGTEKRKNNFNDFTNQHGNKFANHEPIAKLDETEVQGRYPAQTYINNKAGERLDEMSGDKTGAHGGNNCGYDWAKGGNVGKNIEKSDTGGCSKVLHKCDYEKEEHDLYFYNPKVSKSERNAGCEEMDKKENRGGGGRVKEGYDDNDQEQQRLKDAARKYGAVQAKKTNSHPTVKPISLNHKILSLFKTPNEQRLLVSFAGSGSEVIGAIKAGYKNIEACEINQEYIDIANARIAYWSKRFNDENRQQSML